MNVEVELSYEGLGLMLNAPWMEAEMKRRIDNVEAHAVSIAPVGKEAEDPHAGRYKDSFSTDSGVYGGPNNNRAWAALENDSPEALYVEYGNRGAEPYGTMLKALVEGGRD